MQHLSPSFNSISRLIGQSPASNKELSQKFLVHEEYQSRQLCEYRRSTYQVVDRHTSSLDITDIFFQGRQFVLKIEREIFWGTSISRQKF